MECVTIVASGFGASGVIYELYGGMSVKGSGFLCPLEGLARKTRLGYALYGYSLTLVAGLEAMKP